jgi:hypothetical protein
VAASCGLWPGLGSRKAKARPAGRGFGGHRMWLECAQSNLNLATINDSALCPLCDRDSHRRRHSHHHSPSSWHLICLPEPPSDFYLAQAHVQCGLLVNIYDNLFAQWWVVDLTLFPTNLLTVFTPNSPNIHCSFAANVYFGNHQTTR